MRPMRSRMSKPMTKNTVLLKMATRNPKAAAIPPKIGWPITPASLVKNPQKPKNSPLRSGGVSADTTARPADWSEPMPMPASTPMR